MCEVDVSRACTFLGIPFPVHVHTEDLNGPAIPLAYASGQEMLVTAGAAQFPDDVAFDPLACAVLDQRVEKIIAHELVHIHQMMGYPDRESAETAYEENPVTFDAQADALQDEVAQHITWMPCDGALTAIKIGDALREGRVEVHVIHVDDDGQPVI